MTNTFKIITKLAVAFVLLPMLMIAPNINLKANNNTDWQQNYVDPSIVKTKIQGNLKLDYTFAPFENELNLIQKQALLKSLKKWKLKLPTDNTFTITGLSKVGSDQVVYMRAYYLKTAEELKLNTEEEDSIYNFVEFNAIIRTVDSKVTAFLEGEKTLEQSLTDIAPKVKEAILKVEESKEEFTSSQEVIEEIPKVSSIFDIFLPLEAKAEEYKWPWKAGDSWEVRQDWHKDGYDTKTNTKYALDIAPRDGAKPIVFGSN